MKKILLLFFGVILVAFTSLYFSRNENNGHKGRCTGSAYCTACSSCSRCGHCGAGGTCGVCSGNSSGRNFSKLGKSIKTTEARPTKHYNNKKENSQKTENIVSKTNVVIVSRATNIFEKPSFQSKVIVSVSKNTKLIRLSKLNSWYKVQVKENGKIGYVYYKDVK
ncbi:SH3 domain-containing protein [Chryseobacterium sp. M5]|uniref:SH3 domain-containing protein n=1 Tax=Chryseobacterium sp. M5 TaxID=3379128 RepID=UPI00385721BC